MQDLLLTGELNCIVTFAHSVFRVFQHIVLSHITMSVYHRDSVRILTARCPIHDPVPYTSMF